MSDVVRDERGRVIAHLKNEGDTIRLQDSRYRTLGFFHKNRNITTNDRHQPIGPGNQLFRLIPAL